MPSIKVLKVIKSDTSVLIALQKLVVEEIVKDRYGQQP